MNDYIFKTTPYKHQQDAWLKSRAMAYYALLMEMGTGKTKVCIDTAGWLFGNGAINGLLIVAPKSICRNWAQKEIPVHLPDHIERRVVVWGSATKKFEAELETLRQVEPLKLHVLIVNIEALSTDRCYDAVEKFLRGHDSLMAIDESTTIKNPTAQRTKICWKFGRLAKFRRILTGTPVTQSPLDVYSQFEFLAPACLGSTTYYGFRNQYAVLRKRYINGRSFDEVIGYQRLEDLQRTLGRLSFRALKRDCLDLPEKVYTVRYIELTAEQRKYYEQMRDDALAILSDGTEIPAPLVLTQLLRLRQALCNIVPSAPDSNLLEVKTRFISEKDPRVDEVMSLLQEAGEQKVIIWCNFVAKIKQLQELIAKAYGKESVGCIYGDVKQETRQDLVTEFQREGSPLRFMVMQTRTGGYGLTLTAATLVIYHDNDWSLEVRQQSEDRAHRIGQTEKVTYVDLIAPDTVDEKIRSALMSKQDLAVRVTGDNLKRLLS